MRNPLIKRIPREYKSELGKQLAVFAFFVLIIGAVSGFIVAADSLIKSYNDSFEKYNIEDGNFELMEKADDELLRSIEDEGKITLYENFYKQEETKSFESKLRIFGERDEIDLVDLLEGDMPSGSSEIAIDRLYAQNHKLEKGSTPLENGKRELLEETGAVGYSYISLGQVYPSPGYTDEIIHLYACRIKEETEARPDEGEFLNVERIPMLKAAEMVLNNQIFDAKTQIAVLKTAALIQSGKI